MSVRFEHENFAQKVRFGSGDAAAGVAAEVARLGASSLMLIASASMQQWIVLAPSG